MQQILSVFLTDRAYEMGKQACRDGRVISGNPFNFMEEGMN